MRGLHHSTEALFRVVAFAVINERAGFPTLSDPDVSGCFGGEFGDIDESDAIVEAGKVACIADGGVLDMLPRIRICDFAS